MLQDFALRRKLFAVGRGRGAEEPAVLAAELARALVAHAVAGGGGVERLAHEELARLVQPQLLLELQRAHRRDRAEVLVEGRRAHARLRRKLLDAKRLLEVVA